VRGRYRRGGPFAGTHTGSTSYLHSAARVTRRGFKRSILGNATLGAGRGRRKVGGRKRALGLSVWADSRGRSLGVTGNVRRSKRTGRFVRGAG
jgi:hypothetical protein